MAVGRGGQGEIGQRIRDEILTVQSRNAAKVGSPIQCETLRAQSRHADAWPAVDMACMLQIFLALSGCRGWLYIYMLLCICILCTLPPDAATPPRYAPSRVETLTAQSRSAAKVGSPVRSDPHRAMLQRRQGELPHLLDPISWLIESWYAHVRGYCWHGDSKLSWTPTLVTRLPYGSLHGLNRPGAPTWWFSGVQINLSRDASLAPKWPCWYCIDWVHAQGGMMEEWHQKLHNNTSPDDVVICEALLAYIDAGLDISAYWATLKARSSCHAYVRDATYLSQLLCSASACPSPCAAFEVFDTRQVGLLSQQYNMLHYRPEL